MVPKEFLPQILEYFFIQYDFLLTLSLLHLAEIPTLCSDAFDQMSEISPNFFHPARNHCYTNIYRKVSQYRHLDKVSQLRCLEEDVAIATLWPKVSLLRRHTNVASATQCLSVTIATFRGTRRNSDAFSAVSIMTLICALHKNTKLICTRIKKRNFYARYIKIQNLYACYIKMILLFRIHRNSYINV